VRSNSRAVGCIDIAAKMLSVRRANNTYSLKNSGKIVTNRSRSWRFMATEESLEMDLADKFTPI